VSIALDQRKLLTFRARTYMAFVITPRAPIADWLADLDASLERSKGFFAGHPVALDLSTVRLSENGIAHLVASLQERNIRVLGIENGDFTDEAAKLPPKLRSGQTANNPELSEQAPRPKPVPAPPPKAASLLLESPVRSGQSVVFTEGDVTVLGSVASGAEIIAGGSIHIYGALRGQAMAGATDNLRARIFCHKFEAELLAIGGYYKTADEIEDSLRNGPVQAWLEGSTLKISSMN
jgi:septum site-determining protein MinC